MSQAFQRTKEDFTCGHCGQVVTGNGYTNHCPVCLWSRHVDVNPGDRAETCGGLMEPVGVEERSGQWLIIQRCQVCGIERKNTISQADNFEAVLMIAKG